MLTLQDFVCLGCVNLYAIYLYENFYVNKIFFQQMVLNNKRLVFNLSRVTKCISMDHCVLIS